VARSEIEAELAEEFDLEQLAVYADVLQTEGDPRGELIALDLANSDADREALLVRWLGPVLAATVDTELGFITDNEEQLAAWIAHPAAHYVRGASITGVQYWIGHAAQQLAERSGRWLTQPRSARGARRVRRARTVAGLRDMLERGFVEVWARLTPAAR